MSRGNDVFENARLGPRLRGVWFAQAPNAGVTVGVVTGGSEPSSLALLAAGVAGIAARRARRERINKK